MKNLALEIADQLRKTRAAKGISQIELAQRLGTHQPSIARIESGRTLPSLHFIVRAAEAMGSNVTVKIR